MISHTFHTIVNRTDRTLNVTKDGQQYAIPPGESPLRGDLLEYAKAQNPVPGTDDGIMFQSLIGVKAPKGQPQRDDIDELPEALLAALPKERLDRSVLAPDRQKGTNIETRRPHRQQVSLQEPSEGMLEPDFGRAR